MATLTGPFKFKGKLSGISSYQMRGEEKYVLREGGGPTKNRRKTMKLNKQNNSEFGGASKASKAIRWSIHGLRFIADFVLAGEFTSYATFIQQRDTVGDRGQRSIYFSKNKSFLEGFNLNKKAIFDSIIRNPLSFSVSREAGSASVEIPALVPGINFFPNWKQPYFQVLVTLGTMTDVVFDKKEKEYVPASGSLEGDNETVRSGWHTTESGYNGGTLNISLNNTNGIDDTQTLVLAVGIEVGIPKWADDIRFVKYLGAAKILRLF